MNRVPMSLVLWLLVACTTTASVFAQDSDDAVFRPAEPDFTLVTLPTSLPLEPFKSAFRVTHRFTRPLTEGDFGDLAADLFGIDSGAQIGLEYRIGVVRHGQIGVHRTSNRTIQLFAQYGLFPQRDERWVDVTLYAAINGTNNFKGNHSPAVGAIVSRRVGGRAAVYVEPLWVGNTKLQSEEGTDRRDTVMLGLGSRVRVTASVYVVAELVPRIGGFRPGADQASVAIEKRVGGHVFQLNFSNSFGTTISQIAQGGPARHDWFMGFNISRKFF